MNLIKWFERCSVVTFSILLFISVYLILSKPEQPKIHLHLTPFGDLSEAIDFAAPSDDSAFEAFESLNLVYTLPSKTLSPNLHQRQFENYLWYLFYKEKETPGYLDNLENSWHQFYGGNPYMITPIAGGPIRDLFSDDSPNANFKLGTEIIKVAQISLIKDLFKYGKPPKPFFNDEDGCLGMQFISKNYSQIYLNPIGIKECCVRPYHDSLPLNVLVHETVHGLGSAVDRENDCLLTKYRGVARELPATVAGHLISYEVARRASEIVLETRLPIQLATLSQTGLGGVLSTLASNRCGSELVMPQRPNMVVYMVEPIWSRDFWRSIWRSAQRRGYFIPGSYDETLNIYPILLDALNEAGLPYFDGN